MKRTILALSLISLAAGSALCAQSAEKAPAAKWVPQQHGGGTVVTPLSGIEHPGDAGVRMHTNFKIFVPPGRPEGLVGFPVEKNASPNTPVSGEFAETPSTLACLYGEVSWTAGCNPAAAPATPVAIGGSKAIAIVDAYDYPTALADLTAYSKQFGLPAPVTTGTKPTLTVTWPAVKPTTDPNAANNDGWNAWEAEEALDIEMAHAAAPAAQIFLVEALSSSTVNLIAAVKKAITLVEAAGGGEVSMSWGGGESSNETLNDSAFTGTNVVFFASTGDREGTEYPSVSPNVVAVGGTTLTRSPASGDIEAEVAWEDGGGGFSEYELQPAFQDVIFGTTTGNARAVPDVAAIGNPRTGVWVYDSFQTEYNGKPSPWNIFGGTSVASPLWAGLVNHAGHFAASTAAEEKMIYANDELSPNLRDITYGTCGYYEGWFAGRGWDPCTGLGAPYGSSGK